MDWGRGHSSSSDILVNLLFLVFVCVTVFCDRLLSNSPKYWNGLEGKKHYAMSSTHFLLDISGKESGKWGSSEPMHGEKPVWELILFFVAFFPKILLAALGPVQMPSTSGGFKHVCARLCAGLCEANYSWKQLLSQQLASSPSRITLL